MTYHVRRKYASAYVLEANPTQPMTNTYVKRKSTAAAV